MLGQLLDGKALATKLRANVREAALAFASKAGRRPGLRVILVGEDPASVVYTRNKEKAALGCEVDGRLHVLPSTTTTTELLALIGTLNEDDSVDGILVQLPLPAAIAAEVILDAIVAEKDVDGFHPRNVGLLSMGRRSLVPCTPSGSMMLLAETGVSLKGKNAVVVGRSNIVGKPMAQLLLAADATVTIAHSRSEDLAQICHRADIVVAAVGRPKMLGASFIREGAIVIDVGINRLPDGGLVGDVDFESVRPKCSWITPVPGGVGPMTIACLMDNTVKAACARKGIAVR